MKIDLCSHVWPVVSSEQQLAAIQICTGSSGDAVFFLVLLIQWLQFLPMLDSDLGLFSNSPVFSTYLFRTTCIIPN